MTVWYHLLNIFDRRHALRIAGLILVCVALITTVFIAVTVGAAPNTTKTVNFQGRLTTATGSVVADGYYNMQFKIYQNGAGTTAGNPGGTLRWTESYTNDGATKGVQVKNGFFSVSLGSVTPFGTAVDWDQDTLWLSMNVAGNSPTCPTFGTAPCVADGEMLPMSRITATPYSINSGAVGGKTADDLVQLGQGVQTDTSNNSSIAINKTGTGNLIQLQADGKDSFTVNNAGAVTLGSASDQSITVATADSGAGKSLTVSGGDAATDSGLAGGDLVLQGGAGDDQATSGNVVVAAKGADSTGTFQVQDAAGTTLLNVDTINKVVSAGTISLISSASKGAADTVSLWGGAAVPGTVYDDGVPIVLGTVFKSSVPGTVTGVRYYSPAGGTSSGNNTGQLWSCADASCSPVGGSIIGTVNFAADSTEGWKTAQFSTPIPITANTYYQVSYKAATGHYYALSHYFDGEYSRGVLSAPSGDTIRNGRYNDQNNGFFPNSSFNNTNYWADVTFVPATDVDQINSDNELIISSAGPMTVGPTSQSLTMQGSSIDIGAKSGGNVTIQGGGATVADGNGGSVYLSGGAGNGAGATGLVVMTTPTFATAESDANCYTGGALVASSCTITSQSVDNLSAIKVGFSAAGQTATLPDPTIKTAGRVMYIMAAGGSSDFMLATSGSTQISMTADTAATLLWNGTAWISASGTTSGGLQGMSFSPQGGTTDYRMLSASDTESDLTLLSPATDDSSETIAPPAGDQTTDTTPLKVGSADAAPAGGDELLGSMYYDTTLGKLQCYEAAGWGACDASPDTFVTLSPEYTNAVTHGSGVGTLSSDFCSDALNINNGSGTQKTICGANETYNFYNWTSTETSAQTRSFFVTYQLPTTFKEFVPNLTSIMGRTDSNNANVTYQLYRNDRSASLVPCGSPVPVSTGAKTTWQTATATGNADPANCNFAAGDSIVIRINLIASADANAYISNLGFTFSNQ